MSKLLTALLFAAGAVALPAHAASHAAAAPADKAASAPMKSDETPKPGLPPRLPSRPPGRTKRQPSRLQLPAHRQKQVSSSGSHQRRQGRRPCLRRFRVPKRRSPMPMSLRRQLDLSARYDAEYSGNLSSHLPMALVALARLGADDASAGRLCRALCDAPARRRPPPSRGPPATPGKAASATRAPGRPTAACSTSGSTTRARRPCWRRRCRR